MIDMKEKIHELRDICKGRQKKVCVRKRFSNQIDKAQC